jgi:phage terminase small subunit
MNDEITRHDLNTIVDNGLDLSDVEIVDLPMVPHTITRKQFLFIEKFMELEYDAEKAVILAGYRTRDAKKTAETLMKHPLISAEIVRRMTAIRDKFNLTQEEVMKELWSSAKEYGEGASHNARVSALSHLTRILGGFDKGNANQKQVPVAVNMDFSSIDEDED